MKLPTLFGKKLAWLRRQRHLSQRDLAKVTGISKGRIGNIERGQRQPSEREVDALAKALDVSPSGLVRNTDWPGDQDKDWLSEGTRLVRSWFPRRRPVVNENCRFDWFFALACERYPELTDRLTKQLLARDDWEPMVRFLLRLPCGSDLEALFYFAAAAIGARQFVLSLGELAFTSVPIRRGKLAAGALESRYAGLALEWSPDIRLVLVPQVPVKGKIPYRVDFLLAIVLKGKAQWAFAEIDGGAHDGRFDDERTDEIGIPVLRLGESQVVTGDLSDTLLWAIESALDESGRRLFRDLITFLREGRREA